MRNAFADPQGRVRRRPGTRVSGPGRRIDERQVETIRIRSVPRGLGGTGVVRRLVGCETIIPVLVVAGVGRVALIAADEDGGVALVRRIVGVHPTHPLYLNIERREQL